MPGTVAVLGGTGFVGRTLLQRWPEGVLQPVRFLVHRSHRAWLDDSRAEVRPVELAEPDTVRAALDGCSCLINLLRPDGSGWLKSTVEQLVATLRGTSVGRLIHASSIDVHGHSDALWVDEKTPPAPQTGYQREHAAIEVIVDSAPVDSCVLRLGAVFGTGGLNLLSVASDMRAPSLARPMIRRALNGQRRMHLVSAENVADVILMAAKATQCPAPRLLVTDDHAPENNFAFVQDVFSEAFGRARMGWVPALPASLLGLALAVRGRSAREPVRRFSNDRLASAGFRPEQPFAERLRRYADALRPAASEQQP